MHLSLSIRDRHKRDNPSENTRRPKALTLKTHGQRRHPAFQQTTRLSLALSDFIDQLTYRADNQLWLLACQPVAAAGANDVPGARDSLHQAAMHGQPPFDGIR